MDPAPEAKAADPDSETNAGPTGDGEGGTPRESEPLPLSHMFDLLSNDRRRRVLRVLRSCGGTSTLGEVAERVAAWENDKEIADLRSDERKRTYVGLYQCHLPKMDDADVVVFDKHRGDVRLGPAAPLLFEYLDVGRDRPWARYYLALAGVWGGVLLMGALAGVPALTSPAAVALLVLTFVLCSLAHVHASGDAADGSPPFLAGGGAEGT